MEKSVYSSTPQLPSFPSAPAESSWTAYLDDPSDDECSFSTSSLLSDAASHAAADPRFPATDHLKIPRRLTLKPKQAQFFVDTSLESTASSPDNSPKVADNLGPFDGDNYRRKSSLGNGRTMGEQFRGDHEINLEMDFERKATDQYTDLKKRGLCLVPMSVFANYLG